MITKNFVTEQTIRDIDDINKRCKDLHVPAPPFVFVTTDVFNADGTPVLHQHEQARSWTRNLYNLLAGTLLPAPSDTDPLSVGYGPGSLKIKAYNGAVTNYWEKKGVYTDAEGTMPNNADNDVEVTDVDGTTIPAGYYNGTGAAKLSDAEAAKVIAGNVKSGVTLLGVTGTLVEHARAVIESVLTVPTAPSLTITAEIQEE